MASPSQKAQAKKQDEAKNEDELKGLKADKVDAKSLKDSKDLFAKELLTKDAKDGKDGKDEKTGKDGKDAKSAKDAKAGKDAKSAKAVKAGKDGKESWAGDKDKEVAPTGEVRSHSVSKLAGLQMPVALVRRTVKGMLPAKTIIRKGERLNTAGERVPVERRVAKNLAMGVKASIAATGVLQEVVLEVLHMARNIATSKRRVTITPNDLANATHNNPVVKKLFSSARIRGTQGREHIAKVLTMSGAQLKGLKRGDILVDAIDYKVDALRRRNERDAAKGHEE